MDGNLFHMFNLIFRSFIFEFLHNRRRCHFANDWRATGSGMAKGVILCNFRGGRECEPRLNGRSAWVLGAVADDDDLCFRGEAAADMNEAAVVVLDGGSSQRSLLHPSQPLPERANPHRTAVT